MTHPLVDLTHSAPTRVVILFASARQDSFLSLIPSLGVTESAILILIVGRATFAPTISVLSGQILAILHLAVLTLCVWKMALVILFVDVFRALFPCRIPLLAARGNVREMLTAVPAISVKTTSVLSNLTLVILPHVDQILSVP